MQDPFDQFENPMSSSLSCEMLGDSGENLRASASSFYPNKEQDKLDDFTVKHSIAQLRENGTLLTGIKALIDNLSVDHKSELVKYISSSTNFDLSYDVEQYQMILSEVKADRQKLRSQNKQNLQHIESLERSLQNYQLRISELHKQQQIDKEFFENFEKRHLQDSSKKCSNCSETNFSRGRAAAEKETLRQPTNFNGWVEFDSKPVHKKKVFDYKPEKKKMVYGTYNDESSGEMDDYQVVPIENEERFSMAPQRKSKQKRSYNRSNVSKFSEQQIDSSQVNQPMNETVEYQEFHVEEVDFTKKSQEVTEPAQDEDRQAECW